MNFIYKRKQNHYIIFLFMLIVGSVIISIMTYRWGEGKGELLFTLFILYLVYQIVRTANMIEIKGDNLVIHEMIRTKTIKITDIDTISSYRGYYVEITKKNGCWYTIYGAHKYEYEEMIRALTLINEDIEVEVNFESYF